MKAYGRHFKNTGKGQVVLLSATAGKGILGEFDFFGFGGITDIRRVLGNDED